MKKLILIAATIFMLLPFTVKADEGLWLPALSKERIKQMKKGGLKLSAEEIYSVNQACIKDAVIGLSNEGLPFQSFATASFISADGLVLTNYHPVMRYVEFYSNNERDFLKYGYWAKNKSEESVCHGLWVKQLVRIEDVTAEIMTGTDGMSYGDKMKKITDNNKEIIAKATKGERTEALITSFHASNQYIMCVYKIFKDVRLVAVPPMAIGKFGGLSDNWQWPRYTGDFAILRVYANQNQNGVLYNKEKNVPYRPKSFLKISLDGVQEGDFAMVAGYPATTREYIPANAFEKKIFGENVARIQINGKKIAIMNEAIENDSILRHRYTARISATSNNFLRDKGELMGARRLNVLDIKKEQGRKFTEWVNAKPERIAKYGTVLADMDRVYNQLSKYNMAAIYLNDACLGGSEIVPYIGKFEKVVSMYGRKKAPQMALVKGEVRRVAGLTDQFFGNWSYETDRKLLREMLIWSWENTSPEFHPQVMRDLVTEYNGDVEKMTIDLFAQSSFTNPEKAHAILNSIPKNGVEAILNDKLYQLSISFFKMNVMGVMRQQTQLQNEHSPYYTLYMEGLLEMNGAENQYPDANKTMRISYGKVSGISPEESVAYGYYTTLNGMMDKYNNNRENTDYHMPRKLQQLHSDKDYGRYANKKGELVTCFITDCHTSSGSSGSPVLNGKGELIGLNFDRMWQGLISNYHYDSSLSRNIAVDVRYIFFVLEKYSPSSYIFDELKFVRK